MILSRRLIPVLPGLCLLSLMALFAGQKVPATEGAQVLKKERVQLPEEVETDIVTREAYCRWAAQPPVLDGKLDDKCWEQAAPIEQFASYWTKTSRAGTKAYLVWDDEARLLRRDHE